ncbi:hypothetical protein BDQ12DRAFT_683061 [Crucibulum laeve]|uniref:Uncharacterized protein n=1 Tax=Crucibulum laeve TaxID=68775 RepID=A0A5C3M2N8_9AGAR|nr:hypothetical protein BDQ12DRAFT_683061 [Crucibulum laeve]
MDYYNEPHHDEINLVRLVRRLEKSVANGAEWDEGVQRHKDLTWLKAQGCLQKVKHARKLLKNVEIYDPEPSPKKSERRSNAHLVLDRIELFFKEVQSRSEPELKRPPPILPTIPIPEPPAREQEEPLSPSREPSSKDHRESIEASEQCEPSPPHLPRDDLLLSPSDTAMSSLLPSHPSDAHPAPSFSSALASSINTAAPRKNLQPSAALHEELSTQLANMAAQLKANTIHFSTNIAKDQAVVQEAQEKIEANHDVMLKERVRLRDHRGQSRSTTCLVVSIVFAVLLLFVLMVGVIRISGR